MSEYFAAMIASINKVCEQNLFKNSKLSLNYRSDVMCVFKADSCTAPVSA